MKNIMKKCFIVTPIGSEGSEVRKRADKVYKYIIEPTCAKCHFQVIRVDQINETDSITQTIINMLGEAELVIADLTDHNPNAFYEMGYRACTGKPMINIKQKGESIPFDIASIRAFDYDLSDLDSVEEVKSRLEQTIISLNIEETSNNQQLNNSDPDKVLLEKGKGTFGIFPILYDIQDQISRLREDIHNKDIETIQAIVKANSQPVQIEDSNTALLKVLLPEFIRNPDSFKTLIELSRSTQNTDKG